MGARSRHTLGRTLDLVTAFYAARTGHYHYLVTANVHIANLHYSATRPKVAASELVGRNDAMTFLHAIQHFERRYLEELLSRCAGNVSLAARIACKERRAFQRLLRKHNLTGAEFRELPGAAAS